MEAVDDCCSGITRRQQRSSFKLPAIKEKAITRRMDGAQITS